MLEGSWVVISRVISPLLWVITTVTLLITPLITTHEPPSDANRSKAHSNAPRPCSKAPSAGQLLLLLLRGFSIRRPRVVARRGASQKSCYEFKG